MPRHHPRTIALLILLSAASLPAPSAASGSGFGVAPRDVDFGDVLRNEPVVRSFGIQNSGNTQLTVDLTVGGPLGPYLQLPTTNVTIPPHETHRVHVALVIASDVPNGAYNGTFTATKRPPQEVQDGQSGVGVALAIPVRATAVVTGTEIVGLAAEGEWVPDVETGNAIPVSVHLINTGNVRVEPTLHVTARPTAGGPVLLESQRSLGLVVPGVMTNTTARFDNDLRPGQYALDLRVVLREDVVRSTTLLLDVLAPGELSRKGVLVSLTTVDAGTRLVENRLPVGHAFVVVARFDNVGETDASAVLRGYATLDGRVVRELVTAPVDVGRGENVNLTVLVTDLTEPGTYTIVGRVHYGSKITEERTAILNLAPGPTAAPGAAGSAVPGPTALALVGVLLVAAWQSGRRTGGRR